MAPLGDSAGKVGEIVAALKDGIGAVAAAVFDDDRGHVYASSEQSAKAFWNAWRAMGCSQNWGAWYREIRTAKRLVATCSCGGEHGLYSHLLFERWVVMIVVAGPRVPHAEAVIESAVRLLSERLSRARIEGGAPPRGPRGGGGGESARLGIPVWWVRKS